jgi:hypothetical protein
VADLEGNKQRSRRLYFEVFGDGNYAAAEQLMTSPKAIVSPAAGPLPEPTPVRLRGPVRDTLRGPAHARNSPVRRVSR